MDLEKKIVDLVREHGPMTFGKVLRLVYDTYGVDYETTQIALWGLVSNRGLKLSPHFMLDASAQPAA